MSWTAPADWTVSELVTAAKLNTHVRDNLAYLKGATGAIVLDATKVGLGGVTPLGAIHMGAKTIVSEETSSIFGYNAYYATGWKYIANDKISFFAQNGDMFCYTAPSGTAGNTATLTARMVVKNTGEVGFGVGTTPAGLLHGYGAISGFLKWEYDGLDGTARTVIPNGTGDVLYGIHGLYICRSSGGGINTGGAVTGLVNGGNPLAPGASVNLYNDAGNTVVFAVAADGSVTVQRTAGALTYKVSMLLQWC